MNGWRFLRNLLRTPVCIMIIVTNIAIISCLWFRGASWKWQLDIENIFIQKLQLDLLNIFKFSLICKIKSHTVPSLRWQTSISFYSDNNNFTQTKIIKTPFKTGKSYISGHLKQHHVHRALHPTKKARLSSGFERS